MNKEQKRLKQQYKTQPSHCQCGFPIQPTNVTIHEGFFSTKRIYKEYNYVCEKCNKSKIIIG